MKYLIFSFLTLYFTFPLIAQDAAITEQTGIESEITITINPNNPDELIVASMGSSSPILIYTSSDGGDNWSQTSFGEGIADPVLTYGDNGTAYLTYLDFGNTLELSLCSSNDNGSTWDCETLPLDGKAADRQWIKRDNTPSSPFYGNTYFTYFHPEDGLDIHIVKVDNTGAVGMNQSIQSTSYDYVQNPAMDITSAGNIVVCFLVQQADDSFQIVSVTSTDGSENFSSEVAVTDIYMYDAEGIPLTDVVGFAPGNASRLQNSLQMAIDKSTGPYAGRVYLTWTDFVENNVAEGLNVYLSYSDDDGTTWSSPAIVNDDNVASSHQYFAGIDVNPNGVLCLSWYDRRVDPDNDAITDFYFTSSTDGGQSFVPSVKVNTVSSDHNAVTMGAITFGVGEYNSLATSATEACVVWSDGRNNDGDMDVYTAKIDLDNPTNITEIALTPSLIIEKLFPNPITEGQLILELHSSIVGEVSIAIKSIVGGSNLYFKKSNISTGVQEVQIEVAQLPAGNYLLEVKHQEGTSFRKFVIAE